ncbi:MAG: DNA polymerase III subunit gamma/tau [Planctomycetaceae bacterium]|nr:DNA polymerase III subunit gamma/tau [Planctomycetaceae bacterium]
MCSARESPVTAPASYTALARRYRPQTFDEVVGQGHVAQALRNALRKDRVSHAYLFTGARGVGKTSTARIFAKALNCPNVIDGVPCNECDVCRAISVGFDVDVLEIDAASNRGIDDVRQLRANVNIRPMRSRHKVYIIDEAHQLSKDAWNALLKTLEEPPPNVKFFFCTTEPNKLPDTILSRCQRFDFSSVETTNIVTRLEQIASAEGFTVDPAALDLVARRAAGSMRDSQSLFDQLLAFGSEEITVADVHRLFGTADDERLIALASSLAERQPGRSFSELNTALDAGVQIGELFDQLIGYFRDLLVLAAGADDVPLLSVSPDRRDVLTAQASQLGLNTILAATQILSEARQRMQRTSFGRPIAELALTRVAMLGDLDDLSDLIAAVRSGNAGARPTTSPRRSAAPVAAMKAEAPSAAPPLQKKSSDEASVAVAEPTSPPVAFEAGREADLLEQLRSRAGTVLGMHLAGVSRTAILGPNALELTFPKRYSSSRQYVEGTDGRQRIQEILAEMAGRPVQVTCRQADDEALQKVPVAAPNRGRPARNERQRPTEVPEEDEFVQKALSIFEARVMKVTELSARPSE